LVNISNRPSSVVLALLITQNMFSQDWNTDGSHGYELAMNHMGDVASEEHRAMLAGNRRARAAWAADPRQVRPHHRLWCLREPKRVDPLHTERLTRTEVQGLTCAILRATTHVWPDVRLRDAGTDGSARADGAVPPAAADGGLAGQPRGQPGQKPGRVRLLLGARGLWPLTPEL